MPINPFAGYLYAGYLFRKTPVGGYTKHLSTGVLAVDNFSYQSVPF